MSSSTLPAQPLLFHYQDLQILEAKFAGENNPFPKIQAFVMGYLNKYVQIPLSIVADKIAPKKDPSLPSWLHSFWLKRVVCLLQLPMISLLISSIFFLTFEFLKPLKDLLLLCLRCTVFLLGGFFIETIRKKFVISIKRLPMMLEMFGKIALGCLAILVAIPIHCIVAWIGVFYPDIMKRLDNNKTNPDPYFYGEKELPLDKHSSPIELIDIPFDLENLQEE